MTGDSTAERLQPKRSERDGLYHVALPGIKKDPLWINYMDSASQKAVQLMDSASGNIDIIIKSERNLSILIRRLKKLHGDNQDDLIQATQFKIQAFASKPTLKDITDYVIADAHYNYRLNDPEFKPIDTGSGITARVVCNYGTPRELEPAFETPFQGQYKINPYQEYAERAQICKVQYSDTDGYMRAPLAKLVPDPTRSYVFEPVDDQSNEELRLTKTGNNFWWHTDTKYFDAIWNHIHTLYTDLEQLVKSDQSINLKDAKILLISQVAWWYFQMTPYTRGSGAIGIALLQSLFDFSGIKNSPYKEGVSPDLEALVTPPTIYVKNFSKFFTREFE